MKKIAIAGFIALSVAAILSIPIKGQVGSSVGGASSIQTNPANGGASVLGGTCTDQFVNAIAAGTAVPTCATVGVVAGGTNITSYTIGDLLFASASTTLSKLADVAVGRVLISGGVGVAPSWSSNPPLIAGAGTQTGHPCISVFSDVSSTGSSTGGNVNVSTYTVPANTLSADGASLKVSWCSLHAANTNSANSQPVYFGFSGNAGSVATSGGMSCSVDNLTRKSSSVLDWVGYNINASFNQYRNHITSVDFTTTNDVLYRFNATIANNDLTGEYMTVSYCPAN